MKYPSLEVRKPRAVFTAKLQSLLRRLDSCATADITSVFLGSKITCPITVTDVWVVGSYARGATHCGDLDIVVRTEGGYVLPTSLNQRLLGKVPDVRVYLGTPAENQSGIPFPEAVKVWGADTDWAAVLQTIPEDATVTRFPRKIDRIPLRIEQLRIRVELAEEVVDDQETGLIAWTFVPLDVLSPATLTGEEVAVLDNEDASHVQRRLLPYIKAYLATLQEQCSLAEAKFDDFFWKIGGTLVRLGPGMPNYDLLNSPGISRIAVMPDLNVRGPNGIWVIERGPAHPLSKAFENAGAWFIASEGTPVIVLYMDEYNGSSHGVDVFDSEAAAREHIAEVYGDEDVEEFGPPPEPMYVSGADYLAALGGIELIDYVCVGETVAFSRDAARKAICIEAHWPGIKHLPGWFQTFFSAAQNKVPA